MAKSFNLVVKDREKTLFEGEAVSFSSKNARGNFDVLANHANFISLVDEKISIRDIGGALKEIDIQKGVIKVMSNKIEVYVGVGIGIP